MTGFSFLFFTKNILDTPTTVIIRPYKNGQPEKIWLTLYYERGRLIEEDIVKIQKKGAEKPAPLLNIVGNICYSLN